MYGARAGIVRYLGCTISDADYHIDERAFADTRLANEDDIDFDTGLKLSTIFTRISNGEFTDSHPPFKFWLLEAARSGYWVQRRICVFDVVKGVCEAATL